MIATCWNNLKSENLQVWKISKDIRNNRDVTNRVMNLNDYKIRNMLANEANRPSDSVPFPKLINESPSNIHTPNVQRINSRSPMANRKS